MGRSQRVAFVCPRFPEGATVGGAETLLRNLAVRAAAAGREVTFLTTCARDHFTWRNEVPPGERVVDGVRVRFFEVDDDRDVSAFLEAQRVICNAGAGITPDTERVWIENSVNSRSLIAHLREAGDAYDRIVAGPYLFGLVYHAAQIHPHRTLLVPCLHDEPFAALGIMADMFRSVSGFMFNTAAERNLATRLYGVEGARCRVVGMGIDPFEVDPCAFARRRGLTAPYVLYCGRREPMKGTPLLLDYVATFRGRTGRDIKVVLTGSGPIDPPSELLTHVLDAGFVSEQEKHEAMAGALAFCHPSVNESFGIVLMEAWQAGAAALVHACGEVLRTHCRDSNGGLWFRTYPEFEEELLLLHDNPELRRRMGEAGRAYVRREYDWSTVTARMLDALDRD